MRKIVCTNLITRKNSTYLGLWALKDSEILSYKNKKVIDFIWRNKKSFLKDSIVIKKIILKLYQKLFLSLNKTHNTKYSKKFWKILIFPWIYYYVSALYFRWQSIKKIKKKNNIFIFAKKIKYNNNNYDNNVEIFIDNYWNQKIFQEIVLCQKKNYIYQKISQNYKSKKKKNFFVFIFSLIPNSLIDKINNLISFLKKRNVLFIRSPYIFKNFIFSFLRIYNSDFLYNYFFKKINTLLIQSGSSQINLKSKFVFYLMKIYRPKTEFENFLLKRIAEDIPNNLLQDFNNYLNRRIKFIDAKIILTSYSLFEQTPSKFYIAEQVDKGSTLYLIEHGGSLASKEEMLNLETTVADKKLTWFKPLLKKHVQIPTHPYCFLNLEKKSMNKKNKNIIIIGTGAFKHVWNCTFNLKPPMSLEVIENINKFYNILNFNIKKNVFIKPHPEFNTNKSFNFMKFYKKIFNKNIIREYSLKMTVKKARILVCTYPETTFAFAMYSSVPTILIYNKDHYIFHKKTIGLIKDLIKNKIIFNSPERAAKHINEIYENPQVWYNSMEVKKVRSKFLKIALGIVYPRDIDREKNNWKKILK
jgi:putative transferase (TIGR04331 family)